MEKGQESRTQENSDLEQTLQNQKRPGLIKRFWSSRLRRTATIIAAAVIAAGVMPATVDIAYNKHFTSEGEKSVIRNDESGNSGVESRLREKVVNLLNKNGIPRSHVGSISLTPTMLNWGKIIRYNGGITEPTDIAKVEGPSYYNPGLTSGHITIGSADWPAVIDHEVGEKWAFENADKPELKEVIKKASARLHDVLEKERKELKALRQGTREFTSQLARVSAFESFEPDDRQDRYHHLALGYQAFYSKGINKARDNNPAYQKALGEARRIYWEVYNFGSDKQPVTQDQIEVIMPEWRNLARLTGSYLTGYVGAARQTLTREDTRNYTRGLTAAAALSWAGLFALSRYKKAKGKLIRK